MAIGEFDVLLSQEKAARAAYDRALAGVRQAQAAVREAEAKQRRAEGIAAVAAAIAAVAGANATLSAAAVEAESAGEALEALTGQVKVAWRDLDARVRPSLVEAEAAAEAAFCDAAVALGRARAELNAIRSALGGMMVAPLHIRAPGNSELNAAKVLTHVTFDLPHVEDLARLRVEIESRRSGAT
ncbi:hypothetical protein DK427_12975 [Methylobacterium radiodurans]|uniref:Uncharacterized protein n=1 Tax=Methylobacterium radiodurans TaxID=2202828 RepID=A0A2U8VRX3_9HYPH|nr:hypothetical protein DK427_12975 [Methylobacterium radiodurans]